ncbi:MAG TPA: GumC family protein [Caulobacteraceae bacterium]|nr:GumC family protein [Caulobacteraceae bacterium]
MTYSSTWGSSALPAGGDWTSRPRYTPTDVGALLWRDRFLMIVVFVVLLAIGLGVAFSMKTRYPAHASLLVRLGPEYVYQPNLGDAARGAIPTNDQLVQSEVEILTSQDVRRRVIDELGMAEVMPSKAKAYAAAPAAKKVELREAVATAMGTNLKVDTAPDSDVIRVTYTDTDPGRASLVLNRLLDDYMAYRTAVLQGASEPVLDQQLKSFEGQLADADAGYEKFLADNQITDFDAEKTSLNNLESSLTDESYRVDARLKEIAGRLGEIDRQITSLDPEIKLYHDTDPQAASKLLQLKVDRQDLLSRYTPTSQPVKDIDEKIASLETLMAKGAAQAPGATRIGVNPLYQTVQTEQIQLNAEAASLHDRQGALTDQLAQIEARRQKLNELEPQYLVLTQNRSLLQDDLKGLMQKKQESEAQGAPGRGFGTVRVVERPTPPAAGKSLKKPVLLLAVVFALFTALCVGLARLFTRRGFPTAASASRTLDLPVLASAGYKREA